MLDGIPPASAGDISTFSAARNVRATERTAAFRLAGSAGALATPPAEVLHALDAAARVHEDLQSRGLSVAFDVQPKGDVRVRIVDSGGSVVRELAPAKALDALNGDSSVDDLTA
jgi:hypothetical protein